jgi:hypothetical protein
MSDFLKVIQEDIVDVARESLGDDWSPASLQPALIELRKSYGKLVGPDFSQSDIRLAYALASHPYHALMSYEVLSQCAHFFAPRESGVFSATILGAGPGAEAIALIRILAERMPTLRSISLTLIDKESGWSKTRRTTLEKTAKRWWDGELSITEVTADLATEEGRDISRNYMDSADLVVAQALLTEITEETESVHLLADLLNQFSADSLLLLCDFTRMKGLQEWVSEMEGLDSLRTVVGLQERFPMPACHPDVESMYANQDYLRQRGQVTVTARLYSRPGWKQPEIVVDEDFIPTVGQEQALERFSSFVQEGALNAFVLEGPAGTGKTEIMRRMAAIAVAKGMTVSLWAPTGQAAVRLSSRTGLPASTIHSALFERTGRVDNDTLEREWPPTVVFKRRGLNYSGHVVFIDEASMIGDRKIVEGDDPPELKFEDGRLLSHIIEGVVREGGKVVFVGDSCQLPPVTEQFPVALQPSYLESLGCSVIDSRLTEVRRTKEDSEILHLAMQLREQVLSGLDDLRSVEPKAIDDVILTTSLDLAPFQIEQFKAGEAVALAVRNIDVANLNQLIRISLGRNSELPVPNDRLVLIKGNQILGLMNGSDVCATSLIGDVSMVSRRKRHSEEVETVHLQEVLMRMKLPSGDNLDFETTIVVDALDAAGSDLLSTIRRVLWVDFTIRMRDKGLSKNDEVFWQAYEMDEHANALLCTYSYARTLHRAQGGEWKSVFVDAHSMLPIRTGTSRQAYSAITRAKNALYLRGWPKGSKAPMTHEQLAEGPQSILQRAMRRHFVFKPLPTTTTTVQLSVEDGSSAMLVNLFDGAKGLNFHIDNATPAEKDAVKNSLELWKRLESVRHRHEVPVRLETGMNQLQSVLEELGIDLFVVKPGNANREVELHTFLGENFAIFRCTWTDKDGLNLTKFRSTDTNSSSLCDAVTGAVTQVFSH